MVKGSVTISIEDFQAFLEAAERANDIKDKFRLATKELQVFLSFLATRVEFEKHVEDWYKGR